MMKETLKEKLTRILKANFTEDELDRMWREFKSQDWDEILEKTLDDPEAQP
jgi:hypothetical protein